jgi:hypothetical protein
MSCLNVAAVASHGARHSDRFLKGAQDQTSIQCDVDPAGLADELFEAMVVTSLGASGRDHVTIVPDRERKDESAHMNAFRCRELGQKMSECRDRQHGENHSDCAIPQH